MERKYKIGEEVLVNRDNEILDATIFAYVNLDCGNKQAYSLKVGNQFLFVDEKEIIGGPDE